MGNLAAWIFEELGKRHWRPADLARRSGVSTGGLINILNGHRKAGPEICKAIAYTLGEPPEKVFRLAGLLPALPASEDKLFHEVMEAFKHLSLEKRQEVLEYVLWQLQRQHHKQEETRSKTQLTQIDPVNGETVS